MSHMHNDITPSSPPYDGQESDPVINTDKEVLESEIRAPLSDEYDDQDHDHEHEHDHDHEHIVETDVPVDGLKLRIIKQVE